MQEQRNKINRPIKTIRRNHKGNAGDKRQHNRNELLVGSLVVTKERKSKLEDMTKETSTTKKQEGKEAEKITGYPRTVTQLL